MSILVCQRSVDLKPGEFVSEANCGRLLSMSVTHRMMSALDVQNSFQSSLEEAAELSDYRQRDEDAFWSETRAICRLDAVMEQIETISRARADQRLKDIQSAVATASSAPKKQMFARLVHLRQSFPDGTSLERAHEIANRIRKIGMVEKQRQFIYVFEQTGMTTDELGKNFHMHARFYVKGKNTDVSPSKVVKEVWRITKLDKNSTHIVFHNNIHKLTSYMAGHKSFEEYPDKKIKCEMDVVWRQQHNLKREYCLRNTEA
jgi:hypothetical protein